MKALVYEGPKVVRLREVEVPRPGPGEVLLRTRAVGICGSDVHGFLGTTGRRIPPLIMGHEVVGEVVEAGPDTPLDPARGLEVGRLVAVNPLLVCGRCERCLSGADNLCTSRRGLGMLSTPGAMSEYFVAPSANLVPLLPDVSPVVGALTEPLAVGRHAVALLARRLGRPLAPGLQVAVIGAGFIGLSVLAALPEAVHPSTVVLDVREDRLHRVGNLLPAVRAVSTASIGWEDVRRRYAPGGFDAVVEAVGASETARGSVELARIGGVVVWVGNWDPMVSVPMQHVVTQELVIAGSYGFTAAEFKESVEALPSRPWLAELVDQVLPLERGPEVFAALAAGTTPALKIVLDPTLGAVAPV